MPTAAYDGTLGSKTYTNKGYAIQIGNGFTLTPQVDSQDTKNKVWTDILTQDINGFKVVGSVAANNLVIAGHNYKRHFGGLTNLKPGDEVTLQTMDGEEHSYQVAQLETLAETAVKEMTAGDYPLTLFTCDYSGQARIAVRCQLNP